jgi:hypothetical protein
VTQKVPDKVIGIKGTATQQATNMGTKNTATKQVIGTATQQAWAYGVRQELFVSLFTRLKITITN